MGTPAAGVEFDRNRLSQGELIAGIGGLVLLISMWMDWYGAKVKTSLGSFGGGIGGPNAWQSFSLIDLILFLVALLAIGVAVMRGMNRMPSMPYPPATLLAVAGGIAFLLVLFRFLVQPFDVPDQVDVTRRLGIYLGLLATAAIAYGGWRAMQESGASFGDLGGRAGTGAGPGGGGGGGAPTTPMPAAAGTSTGGPGEAGTEPPAPAAGADPVPGQNAPATPPGIAGDPPEGEGARPAGL